MSASHHIVIGDTPTLARGSDSRAACARPREKRRPGLRHTYAVVASSASFAFIYLLLGTSLFRGMARLSTSVLRNEAADFIANRIGEPVDVVQVLNRLACAVLILVEEPEVLLAGVEEQAADRLAVVVVQEDGAV